MANTIAILSFLLVFAACLLGPATAFLPYKGRYGDLWDAMVDPLKILDQIPDSLTKEAETLTLARTNWKETPEAHVFTLDVPGMKKDKINIQVEENRVLTISGQRVKEEEKGEDKWHRVERAAGKFLRQFRLPGNVDVDHIKANLDNGVLTVSVPKIKDDKIKATKIVDIVETGNGKAVE